MRSQGRVLAANGRYVLYALKPMLVMIVPMLLLLIQLDVRFGARALAEGETALVKVTVVPELGLAGLEPVLEAPAGIAVETPPCGSRRSTRSTGGSGPWPPGGTS